MKGTTNAVLVGAGVGFGLTLVTLAPFWIAPGADCWRTMDALPECVLRMLMWPVAVFGFAGYHIAEAVHHKHCERLGCRNLHLDWIVLWSVVVNTIVGGLIGAAVSQARTRLRRNQAGGSD